MDSQLINRDLIKAGLGTKLSRSLFDWASKGRRSAIRVQTRQVSQGVSEHNRYERVRNALW